MPQLSEYKGLAVSLDGQPFVPIAGKLLVTKDLSLPLDGQPFVTASGDGAFELTEYLYTLDSLASPIGSPEVGPIIDDAYISAASIIVTEYLYTLDSSILDTSTDLDLNFSVLLKVLQPVQPTFSQVIKIKQELDNDFSTSLNVLSNNLALVTNASSASNPLTPTLVLGGNVIYSNPSTLPPNGLANARCYVNWACDALAGQSLGSMFSWNLDIQDGGGTWRTSSQNDFGNFGEQVEIYGLEATVTEKGREKTNGSFAYVNGGIFGKPILNKPMAFMIINNPQFTTILPDQSLLVPDPSQWSTYRSAVQALGFVASINVQYDVMDYPLTDFSAQAGMTVIEGLNSLAENVGAKLRWKGNEDYVIRYPNKPIGRYDIPDCCLIQAITQKCYLDIKTGIYNPGIYTLYQPNLFDAGTNTLPTEGDPEVTNPTNDFQVEEIWTTSKLITPEDPEFPIDLPFDWESVYVQSITVTDGGGQFVTTDSRRWFLLQTGFAGDWINYNDVGGVLKPQVTISSSLFSQSNADMQAGHFIFKVAVKRKSLGGQLSNSNNPGQESQTLARTQQRFRFVPTCQYGLTVVFSGGMPLPGMEIHGGIGDFVLPDGVIIEHVSLTNPGILNITAIKWSEIKFYTNYNEITTV